VSSAPRGVDYTDWTVAADFVFNAAASLAFSAVLFFLIEAPAAKLKSAI